MAAGWHSLTQAVSQVSLSQAHCTFFPSHPGASLELVLKCVDFLLHDDPVGTPDLCTAVLPLRLQVDFQGWSCAPEMGTALDSSPFPHPHSTQTASAASPAHTHDPEVCSVSFAPRLRQWQLLLLEVFTTGKNLCRYPVHVRTAFRNTTGNCLIFRLISPNFSA